VIKGGQNPAKSYLAQLIGSGAITVGIEPHYITSRGTSDLKRQLSHFFPDRGYFHASEESSPLGWASLLNSKSMLIIDSFSYLLHGRDPADCRHILEEVRKKCKNSDSLLLLVLDDHILERSVDSFAAAVRRLALDEPLRKRMGAVSRQKALTSRDWSCVIPYWLDFYQSVL